eukprot:358130-Chlamydomonas_euryale.AAC.12
MGAKCVPQRRDGGGDLADDLLVSHAGVLQRANEVRQHQVEMVRVEALVTDERRASGRDCSGTARAGRWRVSERRRNERRVVRPLRRCVEAVEKVAELRVTHHHLRCWAGMRRRTGQRLDQAWAGRGGGKWCEGGGSVAAASTRRSASAGGWVVNWAGRQAVETYARLSPPERVAPIAPLPPCPAPSPILPLLSCPRSFRQLPPSLLPRSLP